MIKHLCYINDNYLDLKANKKYHYITTSIKDGLVNNRELFIKDFKNNIKIKNILATSIKILLNKEISESDILYYTSIFEELNYLKIELSSTKNILENNTLIINNNNYILYNNGNYYYFEKNMLDSYLNKLNINKLKIISKEKLNSNDNCKYYYYNNVEDFFIN